MYCVNCGYVVDIEDLDYSYCRSCGTDIQELRERPKLNVFTVKRSNKREFLYDNPEKGERECGKCKRIKPYSEFKNRSGSLTKKRSTCKKCEIKAEANRLQMKSWVYKIEAVKYITKGNNKCMHCEEIGINELPKLDFHHPFPELSTKSAREKGFWRSVRYKSWEQIQSEIDKQKVIVICRNCHQKLLASILREYYELIVESKDPNLNLNFIKKTSVRQNIRGYIKKKFIVLNIWNGKCTICGFGITSNNIDNLPSLEMHHTEPEIKKNVMSLFIRLNSSLEKIIKAIREEKCTCICRNCHMVVQSTFYNNNIDKIFQSHSELFEF